MGSVTLPILEEHINEWLQQELKQISPTATTPNYSGMETANETYNTWTTRGSGNIGGSGNNGASDGARCKPCTHGWVLMMAVIGLYVATHM